MNRARIWLMLLAVLVMIAGLCAVAYPLVSDHLATKSAAEVVTTVTEAVEATTPEQLLAAGDAARAYNNSLLPASPGSMVVPTDEAAYNRLVNVSGDGIMGVLSIPRIAVQLPIYHGTASDTLQQGLGHLYGTSLPVGGVGTHAVVTGHSGMAGKRMLSDLDQLAIDDTFSLRVLGETLYYRVDQIKVVLPEDTSDLMIDPEQDYVTILTCTPFGVNSHRLLVRGVRTTAPPPEEKKEDGAGSTTAIDTVTPTAPSTWRQQYTRGIVSGLFIAIVVVAIAMLILLLLRRRENEDKQEGGTS